MKGRVLKKLKLDDVLPNAGDAGSSGEPKKESSSVMGEYDLSPSRTLDDSQDESSVFPPIAESSIDHITNEDKRRPRLSK